MSKVLITRAEPAASLSATRMREAGFEPLIFPLFTRIYTDLPVPEEGFDAVALTSANAVAALKHSGWKPSKSDIPAYCIGGRTMHAAIQMGFGNLREFNGDREQMATAIARDHSGSVTPILYPAARHRSFDLDAVLAGSGVRTMMVEVYEMKKVFPTPEDTADHLSALGSGYIPVYSKRGGSHLAEVLLQAKSDHLLLDVTLVAISQQALMALGEISFREALVAAKPEESEMINKMKNG